MAIEISPKKLQIDKANATMFTVIAVAGVLVVFSLVSSRALLSQAGFQGRVIKEKKTANDKLEENIKAVKELESSYAVFAKDPTNVLGGSSTGFGPKDGDNAKIVLDSLPSKYDFPALATTIEKMLLNRDFKIEGISGTDEEASQGASTGNAAPEPQPISFSIEATSGYNQTRELVKDFERSIRPFEIKILELTGSEISMRVSATLQTYYQPAKTLEIGTKEIK